MFVGSRISLRGISSLTLLGAFVSALTGCTLATTATDAPIAAPALHGTVMGGQQPIVGAHVYLMAATVSGVGSAGYGLASTSLLSAASTGHSDSVGAYVLTDAAGSYRLDAGFGSSTYDYTCPSSTTQVYLYTVGGDPGSGTNSGATLMAALGSCGSLSSSQIILINELTTVAAAYSLAGFATDALHVSIPLYANATQQTNSLTDALAQTDLQIAFATAARLVSTTTGAALTTTPAGNGTPTTAQVITLGNILAACVNASDAAPANCTTLFSNALSGGATGATPTDTATAAINIAHHPYVSSTVMANLYGLQPGTGAPFAGGVSSQPNDFTVSIKYTGGGLNSPNRIAFDASGNVWVSNLTGSRLSEFSSIGTALSPSTGYTGGGLNGEWGLAIDISGNAWVANSNNSNLSEFSPTGTPISPSAGYTGGGLSGPHGIAFDTSGNVWLENGVGSSLSEFSSTGTANPSSPYTGGGISHPDYGAIDASGNIWVPNLTPSLSKFSSDGSPISTSSGYTGGGIYDPFEVAIDSSGNVWVTNLSFNGSGNSISKFNSSGTPISPSSGYTGGGLINPEGIAIDSSGNVWVGNQGSSNTPISEFSSAGVALSPSSGYTSSGLTNPIGLAIDGAGNVWVTGNFIYLYEFVGVAMPVVTPIVANLLPPYSTPASRP